MPLGGAVPACAAWSATETPLKTSDESPVAVIPGLSSTAFACTKYSDACGNPWFVFHAMSASSRLKPLAGTKRDGLSEAPSAMAK